MIRQRARHSARQSFAFMGSSSSSGILSITITADAYGQWERRAEKEQAERFDGAFAL